MPTAESSSTYVIELLSEHGKRRCILASVAISSNGCELAHDAYDEACRRYPHTHVRMRQGKQTIALRLPHMYVQAPPSGEH
jgi:hypothetical protein